MQQCFLNSLAKVSEVHVQPSSLFPPYKVFVRPSELFLSTGLRSGDREGWKLCRGCYQIYLVTIYCFPMGLHLSQITSYELYSKIKDYWKMFLHKFLKYFTIHVVFIWWHLIAPFPNKICTKNRVICPPEPPFLLLEVHSCLRLSPFFIHILNLRALADLGRLVLCTQPVPSK